MVVDKIDAIENELRKFPMVILVGEGLNLEWVAQLCVGEREASVALTMAPEVSRENTSKST